MPDTRINQAVARPVRTAVQGSAAFAVTELMDSFSFPAMDDRQYAAVLLALTLLFSAIQTLAENRLGKGFLRDVPPRSAPLP